MLSSAPLSYTQQSVSQLNYQGWSFASHLLKTLKLVDFKIKDVDTQEIDESDELTRKWRYIVMAGMALFILPINCSRNLATLRYFSMGIMLIVLFTIGVALFQTPEYYEHNSKEPDYVIYWWAAAPKIKWFQGWATMMLSYNCHITLFYVRGELMHKTAQRLRKISKILIWSLLCFYISISTTGYMSLGEKGLPKIFTLRKKLGRL